MFWYYDLVVESLLKIGGLLQEASLSEHFLSKPSQLSNCLHWQSVHQTQETVGMKVLPLAPHISFSRESLT